VPFEGPAGGGLAGINLRIRGQGALIGASWIVGDRRFSHEPPVSRNGPEIASDRA